MKLASPKAWTNSSASQIATKRMCPSKWWIRKIAGEVEPERKSAVLGKWLHLLAEVYLAFGFAPKGFVEDLLDEKKEGGADRVEEILVALDVKDREELVAHARRAVVGPFETTLRRAADALSAGIHILPPPGHPRDLLERSLDELVVAPYPPTRGFIDVIEIPEISRDSAVGSVRVVLPVSDHKSTSSIASWEKTEDQLRHDPQAILYSAEALRLFESGRFDEYLIAAGYWRNPFVESPQIHPVRADGYLRDGAFPVDDIAVGPSVELRLVVRFRLIYYQTAKGYRASTVSVEFSAEEIVEAYARLLVEDLEEMRLLAAETELSAIPWKSSGCSAFGGCAYRSHCARIGRPTMGFAGLFRASTERSASSPPNPEGTTSMGLQDMIARRKAALAGSSTTTPPPPSPAASPEPATPPPSTPPPSTPPPSPGKSLAERIEEAKARTAAAEINPPDGTPPEEVVDEAAAKAAKKAQGTGFSLPEDLFDAELVVLAGTDPRKAKRGDLATAIIPRLITGIVSLLPADVDTKEFIGAPEGFAYGDAFKVPTTRATTVDLMKAEACRLLDIYEELAAAKEEGRAVALEIIEEAFVEESPPAPVSGREKLAEARAAKETKLGFSLFVGCAPCRQTIVYLDDLLRPFEDAVGEDAKLPSYLLVEYGNGPKHAAAALIGALVAGGLSGITGAAVVSRYPVAEAVAVRELSHYADEVVVAIRGL